MYARLRSYSNIASDCQGAIKTLQRAKAGRRPKGIQGHITAQNSRLSMRERTEAFWLHSHPELDKNKNGRWSPHDFGIWLSDGVAGKEMDEGTYKGKTISSLTVVDGDRILKDLISRDPNRMHITTLGGESVLLDPIKTVVQRRCFDKYCATRDGYRAKAFKPPRWADCTGPWAGRLYGANKPQSVNVSTTCSKIIYDKHLHGENLAKMGASPMDCVCKLCGGADSQHHIIRDCTHREMAACRDKHEALLKRRSSDITARRYQAAPYFEVYLDFALQAGVDSGAYTAWTGILDQRLITRLEGVQPVFGGQGDTITTGLLKECKGLAACVRELHRIRHKLMQAMRGEEVRARTKVSSHRRYKRGHRSAVTHANIRQYTFSQDSTQLQQARHSVWRDNHVLTATPPSQVTESSGAATSHYSPGREPTGMTNRTKTTKTTSNRKRKRARPTTLSQSTTSSELPPILDGDSATEEEPTDVYDNMLTDVHTNDTVNTPVHITTDDVYMYGCTPEGRGNSSPPREPDGIG